MRLVRLTKAAILAVVLVATGVLIAEPVLAQLQSSGGSAVSIVSALPTGSNIIGRTGIDQTTPGTTNGVVVNSGSVGVSSLPALAAGTNIIGFVRTLPPSCTQTSAAMFTTTQVGTGAGSTVTSTTTCITFAFANNLTNNAVTLRLADRAGTPVIWLGGNADFSLPPNSNMRIPIDGVTFTSGITAIAGTATAVNLQINGMQ